MSKFIKIGKGKNQVIINNRYISSIEYGSNSFQINYESIDENGNYPYRIVSVSITE